MPDYHPAGHQMILVLAFAATLLALVRTLPLQNVLAAAGLIALIAGILQTVGEKTGVPFGPYFYTENFGRIFLHLLPWPIPLLWVVVVFNSRGVARLILRPWRDSSHYGYWSIGLTCFLAVLFDAGLDPFAARTNHYWIWQTPKAVPAWYGAPWINFAGWAVTTLLLLGIITPWLINKKPVGQPPPDYPPLILWLVLALLLAAANAAHHLWLAAGLGVAVSGIVTTFAWKNSRR